MIFAVKRHLEGQTGIISMILNKSANLFMLKMVWGYNKLLGFNNGLQRQYSNVAFK